MTSKVETVLKGLTVKYKPFSPTDYMGWSCSDAFHILEVNNKPLPADIDLQMSILDGDVGLTMSWGDEDHQGQITIVHEGNEDKFETWEDILNLMEDFNIEDIRESLTYMGVNYLEIQDGSVI